MGHGLSIEIFAQFTSSLSLSLYSWFGTGQRIVTDNVFLERGTQLESCVVQVFLSLACSLLWPHCWNMHVSLCLFIYLLKVGIKIESDHDQKGYGHDFHDLETLGNFGMVKKFVSWRR